MSLVSGSLNWVLIPLSITALSYFYYSFNWRPRKLKHDADLAREFCPSFVREFQKCKKEDITKCRREMLKLHNCIYYFKGYNQEDKDLL
jgi:hypothetical protein